MLKVSHFLGQSEYGVHAIPLFGKADSTFEKVASTDLLPDVVRYIENLRPSPTSQYVLVNAMGAVEFYGSNINGDAFTEASLVHLPDKWSGIPVIDTTTAKYWPYGFPTFYNAHPFAHHRNKDPKRAFGQVELATWNPRMKRVELIIRVDKDKCVQFGGISVWDKLRAGGYPDVSMGTRVPFDTCSICLDWGLYAEAATTFNPLVHKHPGIAILQYHKKLKAKNGIGIRGLSITRKDYCEHALREMSRIYKDGRKVWVYNDYPRFFDISFVFIGADKTAKVMLFVYRNGNTYAVKPSAEIAEELNVSEPGEEKTASVDDLLLKQAFGKLAKPKLSEIKKNIIPSQFAGKAVPLLTKREPDIPREMLDRLAGIPLENTLATTSGMGILLKPSEFQRITLIQLGQRPLADKLDSENKVFAKSDKEESIEFGTSHFLPALLKILLPLLADRSALGPVIERRIVSISGRPEEKSVARASHKSELLDKIGAAYISYRQRVMEILPHIQNVIASGSSDAELCKVASAPVEDVFTPLSVAYFQNAFEDEYGVDSEKENNGNSQRVEGPPLEEHVALF